MVFAPVAKVSQRLTTELDAKPFQTALLLSTSTGKVNALAHQDRTRSPLAVDVMSHSTTRTSTPTLASESRPTLMVSAPAHPAKALLHTELVARPRISTLTHAYQHRPTTTESALAQQVRLSFNMVLAARLYNQVFQEVVTHSQK